MSLVPTATSAANCQFVLGFKALHDLIPATVGDCLVDEHHNPVNGDGLQETTGPVGGSGTGLLVWRKADNWTAYTDGYHTWINGPDGIQERLNTGPLFPWEAPAPVAATPAPAPSTSSGVTFTNVTGGSPGGVASVSVQTSPNASCSITYVTPHGTTSVAAGLVPESADANGNVGWSWKIGTNTIPGTGTVSVMCGTVTTSVPITITGD
jgi:hypothetical protein